MRKTILSGAIALSLASFNIHALSVGEMNVNSHLGEALNVVIDLNAINKSELSTLEVSLASRASFEQAGIRYPAVAEDLIIEVDTKQKDKPKILVKSINSISEPFVHMLLNISWAGGNMLREYTVLIDPVEYKLKPVAQAASPDASLQVASPAQTVAPKNPNKQPSKIHGIVKRGDSLSAIAALYRPTDVSIHQAWMAFYNLNRGAFAENNLNSLKKGSEIRIPTRAQMTSVSRSKAAQEVKKLSKPLGGGAARAKSPTTKAAPKLVVGGDKEEPARAEAKPAQTPEPAAKATQATAAVDSEQIASVRAEFGEFKQDITQQLSENSAQNAQFKEELVATRGEGRVLNERIGELEKQLSNISRLLELQSEAMQALNENIEKNGQMQMAAAASNTNTRAQPAPEAELEQASKAESLAEMTAQKEKDAAALESAPPSVVSPSTEGATPPADTNSMDQSGGDTDVAEDSVPPSIASADEVQAKIAQSEQRIESLEKEYEEKLEIAQQQAQDLVAQADHSALATNTEPSQLVAEPQMTQPESTVRVAPEPAAPQPIVERSFMDKAMAMLGSISAALAGISSDIWKIIGVIAAALLGLFAYNGARRRRTEQAEDDDYEFSTLDATDASLEVGDSTSELVADKKLHGSSLFDLSDDSFMEGEPVYNDSSMFLIEEEEDPLADEQDLSNKASLSESGSSGSSVFNQLQSSTIYNSDVDPLTEANVYAAYDRKEQAINVLEQALEKNPNQGKVLLKLLTLYQEEDNEEAFTKMFESAIGNIDDDEDWDNIKQVAQEFIPEHQYVDSFDGSTPVLLDAVADDSSPEIDAAEQNEEDILSKAIQELEDEDALDTVEPEALTLSDDMILSIDDEMEEGAGASSPSNNDAGGDLAYDIGFGIDDDDHGLELDLGTDTSSVTEQNDDLELELDQATEEVSQHDPQTALELAKAYIELGENDIAKDFLNDVIVAGSKEIKGEAEELLASVS